MVKHSVSDSIKIRLMHDPESSCEINKHGSEASEGVDRHYDKHRLACPTMQQGWLQWTL